MSTWEERMAVRTAARSVVTGAEEFLADREGSPTHSATAPNR